MKRIPIQLPYLGGTGPGQGVHSNASGGGMSDILRAPFPWFGGKRRAADLIWPRFGDVPNYVEPFFGSGAVLLARPHPAKIETVNDADCFLANFWRAIAADPNEVARWADWPVNEADLEARHRWLVARTEFRAAIKADAEHYDPKVAGWWVWGLCAWIGSGWCSSTGETPRAQLPDIGMGGDGTAGQGWGRGIHSKGMRGDGGSPPTQLPHLGNAGMGVHRKLPDLGNAGRGARDEESLVPESGAIRDAFARLSARLRRTRVACGDFERVLSDSVTWRHGTTGILLDPPYADGTDVYSGGEDARGTFARCAAWAAEHGADERLRIALCGYEGTWTPPDGWETVAWKAHGGYGSQREDGSNENAQRERIWFSPGCLKPDVAPRQRTIFDLLSGDP